MIVCCQCRDRFQGGVVPDRVNCPLAGRAIAPVDPPPEDRAFPVITRLDGIIESVRDGRTHLRCGAIVYELLIPGCDEMALATVVGEQASFHTLHYLESQGQGSSYVPRLVGFASQADRTFFEMLTSVKGLGVRKALRSMQLPAASIAEAIAAGDIDLLRSLPEIGKKTAETIVLELKDRVTALALAAPRARRDDPTAALVGDAATVLVQLGETAAIARSLVERAIAADPEIAGADALVTAALRLRDGAPN